MIQVGINKKLILEKMTNSKTYVNHFVIYACKMIVNHCERSIDIAFCAGEV